ncbi:MAG: hypothetical protein HW421_3749 [Ignavibacteria bacterium]|nr:hypothetical protein [Ignavibacteria bacterium]
MNSISSFSQYFIKNGSFEKKVFYRGQYVFPLGTSEWAEDEVTRCLGMWDTATFNPNSFPPYLPAVQNRYKTKENGGCDGWYCPSLYDTSEGNTLGTPDYFNRNPNDYIHVPDNFVNYFGNLYNGYQVIQEAFDEDKNGSIDTNDNNTHYDIEDSYVGVYYERRYKTAYTDSNFTKENEETNPAYRRYWAEYITQRLDNPLVKDQRYWVSFRVSWAMPGRNPDNIMSGHALKNIGAFFTHDAFNNIGPRFYKASTSDEKNIIVRHADTAHIYLDSTGGADGKQWMTVCGWYTPEDNDKHFITIGNFDSSWAEKIWERKHVNNPPEATRKVVAIYYYIDSVSIVKEIPEEECWCGMIESGTGTGEKYFSHKIFVEQVPTHSVFRDDEDYQCCLDVKITQNPDSNICDDLDGMKIWFYYVKGQWPSESTSAYDTIYSYPENSFSSSGTYSFFRYCIYPQMYPPEEHEGPIYAHIVFYANGIRKCDAEYTINFHCCNCSDINEGQAKFDIITHQTGSYADKCCWDIVAINNAGCDFENIPVKITFPLLDYPSITFTNGSWSGGPLAPNSYTWTKDKLWDSTAPVIGHICVPADGKHYPYTILIEQEITGGSPTITYTESCSRSWTGEFYCNPCSTSLTCCERIQTEWYESEPPNYYCCRDLYIWGDPDNCCDIYGWRIKQWDCVGYNNLLFSQTFSNPIDWETQTYEYLNICPGYCGGNYLLKVIIEFLDSNGQVICTKNIDVPDPCHYSKISVDGSIYDEPLEPKRNENSIVRRFSAYPNPASDNLNIFIDLSENATVTLEIFNNLGEKVTTIWNEAMNKGNNTFQFQINTIPGGVYYLKLSCCDYIYNSKLFIYH